MQRDAVWRPSSRCHIPRRGAAPPSRPRRAATARARGSRRRGATGDAQRRDAGAPQRHDPGGDGEQRNTPRATAAAQPMTGAGRRGRSGSRRRGSGPALGGWRRTARSPPRSPATAASAGLHPGDDAHLTRRGPGQPHRRQSALAAGRRQTGGGGHEHHHRRQQPDARRRRPPRRMTRVSVRVNGAASMLRTTSHARLGPQLVRRRGRRTPPGRRGRPGPRAHGGGDLAREPVGQHRRVGALEQVGAARGETASSPSAGQPRRVPAAPVRPAPPRPRRHEPRRGRRNGSRSGATAAGRWWSRPAAGSLVVLGRGLIHAAADLVGVQRRERHRRAQQHDGGQGEPTAVSARRTNALPAGADDEAGRQPDHDATERARSTTTPSRTTTSRSA